MSELASKLARRRLLNGETASSSSSSPSLSSSEGIGGGNSSSIVSNNSNNQINDKQSTNPPPSLPSSHSSHSSSQIPSNNNNNNDSKSENNKTKNISPHFPIKNSSNNNTASNNSQQEKESQQQQNKNKIFESSKLFDSLEDENEENLFTKKEIAKKTKEISRIIDIDPFSDLIVQNEEPKKSNNKISEENKPFEAFVQSKKQSQPFNQPNSKPIVAPITQASPPAPIPVNSPQKQQPQPLPPAQSPQQSQPQQEITNQNQLPTSQPSLTQKKSELDDLEDFLDTIDKDLSIGTNNLTGNRLSNDNPSQQQQQLRNLLIDNSSEVDSSISTGSNQLLFDENNELQKKVSAILSIISCLYLTFFL